MKRLAAHRGTHPKAATISSRRFAVALILANGSPATCRAFSSDQSGPPLTAVRECADSLIADEPALSRGTKDFVLSPRSHSASRLSCHLRSALPAVIMGAIGPPRCQPREIRRVADIFVSYTSKDRDWANWIGRELEALGHLPHIDDWEVSAGGNIMEWMEKRHHEADHVLCIVSETYLKKPYSSLERQGGQWAAVTKRPNFVLPVFIEPCEAPTLLAPLKRCDLYGLGEEDARARLKSFLAPAAKPPDAPFPGGVKASSSLPSARAPAAFPGKAALSNIPIRVPLFFMGRDDAFIAIEAALKRYEGRVAITALHGLRGIGKTTLAVAYAERHRHEYKATWWIRAEATSTLRADLVALGVRLGWVSVNDKDDKSVDTVMERLRQEGEGILLIFDNALDASALNAYLPHGAAKVLVTSNAPNWRGVAEPVEVGLWSKAVGADYLTARSDRVAERAGAEALSQRLGGLPLAHEQAAAYCERLSISFAEYHKRFEATPVRLLDDTHHAPHEYRGGLTVTKTFSLAIEGAAKLNAAAEPLIAHAALLAPEAIPLFLFSEGREKLGEPLVTALAGDGLDEAVAALRTFALIDRESIADERDLSITNEAIRLHRLVRDIAMTRREGEARDRMRYALLAALTAVYPGDGHNNPVSWPRCALLTPHVRANCLTEKADRAENVECAELLNRAANYLHARAAYSEGRPLLERALAIYEKVLGPEHPDTVSSLNNLATFLMEQGDLAAARPLFERALAIREKVLGPEHPRTAMSLHNLAILLNGQGDLAAAQPLLERALAIRERVLGSDHPDTATSLTGLSLLLHGQSNLAAARSPCERALAIREKVLGPEHPDTAMSVNNLATLLADQGDLAAARPLFERALAICEKVLGPEHPSTANSLNNLGVLCVRQGDLVAARSFCKRALAIREKVLGPGHPDTARSRDNLARLQRPKLP
jgi:tetratricopeptide (TPR) repeat protein